MVKHFLMNLLLSSIWVALTGSLYYTNFLFGFLLGFFILWTMNRHENDQRYFTRVPKTIWFMLYFIYKMIMANLEIAYDVITPKYFFTPGIVKYPMNAVTDSEINLLSTMVSLTPGTLVLDVSEDKKYMFIHVMYLKDRDSFVEDVRDGLEKRLLEIMR